MWHQPRLSPIGLFTLLILSLCGAFIYDYYKHHPNFYGQLSNETNFIEQVLRDIPTCTPRDRPRQRSLLTTLQAWAKIAEKNNIQYWISYGSLVGYVQRRGLLPHDADVDVTMLSDDTIQLVKMSQFNFSSDYEVRVHPQWDIVGYENRSYHADKNINFVAPNARFVDQSNNRHVDIFPAYNFNPNYSSNAVRGKKLENLTEYSPDYIWTSHPRNWVYPLQTCYFSQIKVLCPAQPEKLVELMYDATALIKSDRKCVDGRWIKSN